jgi:hypothetical protein
MNVWLEKNRVFWHWQEAQKDSFDGVNQSPGPVLGVF